MGQQCFCAVLGQVFLRATGIAISVGLMQADEAQPKVGVPDPAAQQQAMDVVQEVYGKEYEAAKTPAEKRALAKRLLAQAATSQRGTANHYVMVRTAGEWAVEAADSAVALKAVDQLAETYDLDGLAMARDCLQAVQSSANSTSQRNALAEQALSLIPRAVAQDDFDTANRVGQIAHAAAQRARNFALVKQVVARNKEVQERAERYAGVQEAWRRLEANPVDPEANFEVGSYLCLVKSDWEKGIPMLALGNDAELKALAQAELKAASSPEAQVELADKWWDLAQSKADEVKDAFLTHAGQCYQKALPGLASNLLRARVEKRLQEIGDIERRAAGKEMQARIERRTGLAVLRAKWGAFNGWADVTEQVQTAVEDSRLLLRSVGRDLDLGDPAFGHVKALVLVCSYRGKVYTVIAPSEQTLIIPVTTPKDAEAAKHLVVKELKYSAQPRPGPKLTILDAKWGAYRGWLDVTGDLQAAVKDSRLSLANAGSGYQDPAFGHRKSMVIVYEHLGLIEIATVPALGTITLP